MTGGSIQIDGGFGKILAGVVIVLLAAGVIGVWDMGRQITKIDGKIELLSWRLEQVETIVVTPRDRVRSP